METGKTNKYCQLPSPTSLYATPQKNCVSSSCRLSQVSSPICRCAYPYNGTLLFRGYSFAELGNTAPYQSLEQALMKFFQSHQLPVETVLLSDPRTDQFQYLLLDLSVFPYGADSFNRSGILMLAFVFSNQTFKPPKEFFGPYAFNGDKYEHFLDDTRKSKNSSIGIKIGAGVGALVFFLLLMLAGIYAYRQKTRAERANKNCNPFGTFTWLSFQSAI